jgi:hypothetical protein
MRYWDKGKSDILAEDGEGFCGICFEFYKDVLRILHGHEKGPGAWAAGPLGEGFGEEWGITLRP